MRQIFIFINSLEIGGGEKSLISLLNCIEYSKFTVDLMMIRRGGEFEKYIPSEVNILKPPKFYRYLNGENLGLSLKEKLEYKIIKLKSSIEIRLVNIKYFRKNNQQIFYENQKSKLEKINKSYDIAIAYSQGFPTYFVAEKVKARKKYAWINCDYKNTMYNKKIDKKFYENFNNIIAVSESTKESIIEADKAYKNKIKVIKDIVNPKVIEKMAKEEVEKLNEDGLSIVTVARLVLGYKGYDLLLEAARILKRKKINFKWYLIGDGQDKNKINEFIEKNNLKEKVILLGAKVNPYPYMKKSDIYVQTSRIEGFGLTLVEALILRCNIVCTEFKTAKDLIKDEKNGLLVGMSGDEIANGIFRYLNNERIKKNIKDFQEKNSLYNSTDEYEKIKELIE